MTYAAGRSGQSWPDVTSRARCRRGLAWLAGAMEQVFLGDLFPGIIGFGGFTASAIPFAVTGWHGFP
jgi:hypothetical protein